MNERTKNKIKLALLVLLLLIVSVIIIYNAVSLVLQTVYPRSYSEEISRNAEIYDLDEALLYALNGGRDEITRAVRKIADRVKNGEIAASDITEEMISESLYTKNLPDPDLIIRPSGEYRLSNFLTWQSAYSEFWFSNVLWPDFTPRDLERAIDDYNSRNRRFGGV